MRYAALISYDGTEFAGWQRQKNAVSVQEVLENALKTAFHKEITVTASGRTDAGVHAEGQVCHFDADLTLPADKFPEAVNRFLPDGVSLLKSAAAKDAPLSAEIAAERTIFVAARRLAADRKTLPRRCHDGRRARFQSVLRGEFFRKDYRTHGVRSAGGGKRKRFCGRKSPRNRFLRDGQRVPL